MKVCSKCKTEKSLSQFRRDSTRKDGFSYICKDCKSGYEQDRYWANLDHHRNRGVQFYWKNLEKNRENSRIWKKLNPAKVAISDIERNRIQKQSRCSNLSAIQLAQIQEFYDIAAAKTMQTGTKHHVDHIHPLRGRGFNGLHVPWNLQVLTAEENMKKTNRIPPSDAYLMWSK